MGREKKGKKSLKRFCRKKTIFIFASRFGKTNFNSDKR